MKHNQQPGPRRTQSKSLTRRAALKGFVGLGATATLAGCAFHREPAGNSRDAVKRENARAGTRDWLLSHTRIDPQTKYRCPWIEGYCSRSSVRAGEEIGFHVSTNPASAFTLEVYRMGHYGGDGGRL